MSNVYGGKYSRHLDCIGWFLVHVMDYYQVKQVTSEEKRRKLSSISSYPQRYEQYGVKENNRIFQDCASSVEELWDKICFWVAIWLKNVKTFSFWSFSDLLRTLAEGL